MLVLALIALYFFSTAIADRKNTGPLLTEESAVKGSVPCILCGAVMARGEKIKSKEFKGEDHSIVHIYGCSACNGPGAFRQKECPVCGAVLAPEAWLVGKMWKTRKGKMHLRVKGCVKCMHRLS